MEKTCKTCKYEKELYTFPTCQTCIKNYSNWVDKAHKLRIKAAQTCQAGACNPIPISKALHDAILEVHQEQGDPAKDAAVYLILHQLTYLLTGVDIAEPGRYAKSMVEVES